MSLATSNRAIAKALKDIYFAPGGFVGAKKLYERLKNNGIKTTIAFVSDWLKKQSTHSLTVKPKKIRTYLRFVSNGNNDKHVVDLAFMRKPSNGYNAILFVIDVYSRYAEAVPLKSKTSETVAKAYAKLMKETDLDFPRQLISDDGSEFKGAFGKMLKEKNVEHYVARPGVHTSTAIVDRLIYTLKERLIRRMNFSKTDAWDVMLEPLIEAYNDDLHETTNAKPQAVITGEVVPVLKKRNIKKLPLLAVNSRVRIKLHGDTKGVNRNRATDREYWSKDFYLIDSANYSSENIRYYIVRDKTGKKLGNIFYSEELLPEKK